MVWLMHIVCALSITKSFQLQQNRFVPIVSEECKKQGFCEEVENYPEAHVNKIVKEMEKSGEISKSKEFDAKIHMIKNEISTTGKEKSLCKSEMQLIRPRAAPVGKDGVWQFVIDILDMDKLQPILGEKCTFESMDHSCGKGINIKVEASYNFTCRQQYAYRKALVLDHNGTEVETFISLPSCCDCLGKHTYGSIEDSTNWENLGRT